MTKDILIHYNHTAHSFNWVNDSAQTRVVMLHNQKGYPVRASRILPDCSFSIPAGYSLYELVN